MKRFRLCLGLLATCLSLTAGAATATKPPFVPLCQDICCGGLGTPTTPCRITTNGTTVTCGPPITYFCPGV